jgi:aspartate racemase
MAGAIEAAVAIPLVHIADATAARLNASGVRRPALLATRFTMEEDFYTGRQRDRHGIEAMVPDERGRDLVHRIIYDELCRGVTSPESKASYLGEIERLRQAGADGVILGCTEITMLIGAEDTDLPVFDTTRIHAEAAMEVAQGEAPGR